MKKYLFLLLTALLALSSCQQPRFEIKRGANISHWLSQSYMSIEKRATYFTEKDMAKLKEDGFDHVRLPIDEMNMWDKDHNKIEDNWVFLKSALDWCQKYGLRCIVDLHVLRSHSFIVAPGQRNPLFDDPAAQDWLVEMWRQLSGFLKEYPTDMLAYEFMNEPVADDPEDWNQLIARVHKVLRELEPERFLVVGSNQQQSIYTFDDLKIPEGDKRIILSFHYYHPMLLTHHKASWTDYRSFTGTCHYPGVMVTPEEYALLDENNQKVVKDFTKEWNRDMMADLIRPVINKAKELGLQCYCGEWGTINLAPRPDAERWFADMISIFDELDVAWTVWDIKAEFGYWNPDGTIDESYRQILMSGKGL